MNRIDPPRSLLLDETVIPSKNLLSLCRLHILLAVAALASMFLPWASTARSGMQDVVVEDVVGWFYPGGRLLVLMLVVSLVISLLERAYAQRAGCARSVLFIANLVVGIGSSVVPFMRGNVIAPIWGFMLGFFLFILFHAVSIMLPPRTLEKAE
ncbi:MAG: hypothetical protein ABIS50_18500 [Luteolibacter sp.]